MLSEDSCSRDGGGGGGDTNRGVRPGPGGMGDKPSQGLAGPQRRWMPRGDPAVTVPRAHSSSTSPPHDMADAGGRMEVESRGSDTLVPSVGL